MLTSGASAQSSVEHGTSNNRTDQLSSTQRNVGSSQIFTEELVELTKFAAVRTLDLCEERPSRSAQCSCGDITLDNSQGQSADSVYASYPFTIREQQWITRLRIFYCGLKVIFLAYNCVARGGTVLGKVLPCGPS